MDERHKILATNRFQTAPNRGQKKFIEQFLRGIGELIKFARREHLSVVGVGVALAGKVDEERGIVERAPNLLALEKLDVRRLIRQGLKLETRLGNDVQLALYAEHQIGVAKGCRHVQGVFFGTGIGGAVITDGRIYRGASGMGGQVGSILIRDIGGEDVLATEGILDRMVSKAAIAGVALGLASKQWAPSLFKEVGTDLANVGWGALKRSIRGGDKAVDELVRARLHLAGVALSSVVNFCNPEMLVIGGGLTEKMPRLVRAEVERGLRAYLVPEVSKALKIKLARFKNKAGALGAALWAFEKFA
jgi:glucokinase